ncbi:hypothetical protein BC829DRAFT_382251, partial [Chytridium lagenaria]
HIHDPLVAADSKKVAKKRSCGGICLRVFVFLLAIIALTLSGSFIVTNTFTFGLKIPNLRKYLPRKEIVLTTAELAHGKIYDVSAGPKYYGKGGGYAFFSGKDAARAYITGCFQTHLTHDLRGLSEDQIASISQWTDFYENHDQYYYVGRVVHDPIPEDAPLPEDCNID